MSRSWELTALGVMKSSLAPRLRYVSLVHVSLVHVSLVHVSLSLLVSVHLSPDLRAPPSPSVRPYPSLHEDVDTVAAYGLLPTRLTFRLSPTNSPSPSASWVLLWNLQGPQYRGLLKIRYPIEHGIVEDWNDMEKLWQCVLPPTHSPHCAVSALCLLLTACACEFSLCVSVV
jgi:hypothetical protein